jgi:uncharacterized membrane protein (UPF0127 family)
LLPHSPALITTAHGSVLFNVEIAVTDRQRSRGLTGRTSLGPQAGMAFLYFGPTRAGFSMKNTSIPLSVAFFGNAGKILKILDLTPCHQTPCPLYRPGVAYSGALEVNRGAFQKNGVTKGDTIHLAP